MEDLSAAKKNYSSGDAVTLTIYRSGSYTTVQLTFGTAPATTSSSSGNSGSSGSSGKNGSSGKGYNDYYNYFFGNNGSSGSGN